jgi:hypothetical protein
MLGQRRQPLLGADDVADAHEVVVDHVGEVVGREAVRLEQHLVVDLGGVEADRAAEQVVDLELTPGGHLESDDVLLAGRRPTAGIGGVEAPAVAVVAELGLARALLLAQRLEPLARAEAGVGGAARHELTRVVAVDRGALALPVGRVRAADVRPLVPAEAEPAQCL